MDNMWTITNQGDLQTVRATGLEKEYSFTVKVSDDNSIWKKHLQILSRGYDDVISFPFEIVNLFDEKQVDVEIKEFKNKQYNNDCADQVIDWIISNRDKHTEASNAILVLSGNLPKTTLKIWNRILDSFKESTKKNVDIAVVEEASSDVAVSVWWY